MRPLNSLLVTGGCGFIGSAFIRRLLSNPLFSGKIINLDLLTYAASPRNLEAYERHPRYRFVKGDIRDTPLIETLLGEGVDAIIHFAAETHVDRSISSALPFIETNVVGTLSLLEALRKFPHIHFHHVSTDEVYGSLEETGFFHEQSLYRPNSPYSASKAASDHLVRAFAHTYKLSTTISHCGNNYGPGQYPEKLIPLMIERAFAKKSLPVYGEGKNVRDWIYVDDHVEAIWKILQWGESNETYDVGANEELSNLDLLHRLIEVVAQKTGEDPKTYLSLIEFVGDRPGHDFRYAIDPSKIRKSLGWMPQVTLSEGLKKTVFESVI